MKLTRSQRAKVTEKEMDSLVRAGKARYRRTLQVFRQGAAEFARAVCG